jgi:hypothetical protein
MHDGNVELLSGVLPFRDHDRVTDSAFAASLLGDQEVPYENNFCAKKNIVIGLYSWLLTLTQPSILNALM